MLQESDKKSVIFLIESEEVCSLICSWWLQSTAASLQNLNQLPPDTSGGDHKADVQDWVMGGGGCE